MSDGGSSIILGSKRKKLKKRKREDETTSIVQEESFQLPHTKPKKHKVNHIDCSLGTSLAYASGSEIFDSSQKEKTSIAESDICDSSPSVAESGVFSLKSELDALDKKAKRKLKETKSHSEYNGLSNSNAMNHAVTSSNKPDEQEIDPFSDDEVRISNHSAAELPIVNIDEVTVDDVDDLIYLAEANCDLPPEMIERLSTLTIPIMFEIPKSHQIETRLTKEPLPSQRKEFERIGVQMKTGKFNPDEDAIIQKNWKLFCEEFQFDDPRPFILMAFNGKKYLKKEERIHFVQYLGRGLPNRYLHGIYRRFKTLFSPRTVRGSRYQEKLDKIILECIGRGVKNPFSKLAGVLNRDRISLYKRFCVLQSQHNFKGVPALKWSHKTAESIVKALMKFCDVTDIETLRGQTILWSTWQFVADEVGCRPEAAQHFWNKMLSTQIFATKPIFRKRILLDLIKWLLEKNLKHWQDVNWKEVSKVFYDASPLFLMRQLTRIKERIPNDKWASMRDYILFVQQNVPKMKISKAILQRYEVKADGTLVPIKEAENYSDEVYSEESSDSE